MCVTYPATNKNIIFFFAFLFNLLILINLYSMKIYLFMPKTSTAYPNRNKNNIFVYVNQLINLI